MVFGSVGFFFGTDLLQSVRQQRSLRDPKRGLLYSPLVLVFLNVKSRIKILSNAEKKHFIFRATLAKEIQILNWLKEIFYKDCRKEAIVLEFTTLKPVAENACALQTLYSTQRCVRRFVSDNRWRSDRPPDLFGRLLRRRSITTTENYVIEH